MFSNTSKASRNVAKRFTRNNQPKIEPPPLKLGQRLNKTLGIFVVLPTMVPDNHRTAGMSRTVPMLSFREIDAGKEDAAFLVQFTHQRRQNTSDAANFRYFRQPSRKVCALYAELKAMESAARAE